MNPAKPTKGWNQIMTLPRRLTLASKDELAIEPAGDIESLRGAHQAVGGMTLTANQEMVLQNIEGTRWKSSRRSIRKVRRWSR